MLSLCLLTSAQSQVKPAQGCVRIASTKPSAGTGFLPTIPGAGLPSCNSLGCGNENKESMNTTARTALRGR